MSKDIDAERITSFRRIINKLLHFLAKSSLIPGKYRAILQKYRGVNFIDVTSVFFGEDVTIDGIYPQNVFIGKRCIITSGVKILTHFIDTERLSDDKDYFFRFYQGKVVIEDDVFIGCNVVISKPVNIGRGSIIGANTVIAKDVPAGSVIVGSSATIIRNLNQLSQ